MPKFIRNASFCKCCQGWKGRDGFSFCKLCRDARAGKKLPVAM